MSDKELAPLSSATDIDRFVEQVKTTTRTGSGRGRLLFMMDATASRQPTWDQACQLQGDMFTRTKGLGGLDIRLGFYRGYNEFKVGPWHDNPVDLLRAMSSVRCAGGRTQIERVLKFAIELHQQQPIHALVLVGDCMEENIDELCALAGEMGMLKLPLFVFQEGHDAVAHRAFREMARLSGGAHCRFDLHSPEQLGELLSAVAVYASGGIKALENPGHGLHRGTIKKLTDQMTRRGDEA